MKRSRKEGLKDNSLRHSEYYGMQESQDELYAKSLNGGNFKQLMKVITSESNILLAFRNIKRNSGSITEGIDGVTIKDVEKLSQEDFIKIVQKDFLTIPHEKCDARYQSLMGKRDHSEFHQCGIELRNNV